MTENKLPLCKLSGPKIYNNVAKGVMTLRQLAEGYDCSYDQFVAECKRIVSPFEWKRIMKADSRNEKMAGIRKEAKMTEKTPRQQINAQKKKVLLEEFATVQEKAGISKAVTEDLEKRLLEAQKAEANAKRIWQEAQERLGRLIQQTQSSKEQDARYVERLSQIQAKLDEFNLYLVAPGYNGEMPRGRLVSVALFEGYNVTVERGDDLLNDVSFSAMLDLGFETLKEADTALEFAKLVLKYQLECEEEYQILVDDERIITILHGQEVEI